MNKIMLVNVPEKALKKFKEITIATIFMGYFPIVLKIGLITLILKLSKDPKNPLNYRPITLLELSAKIIERTLNNCMQRYCEEKRSV